MYTVWQVSMCDKSVRVVVGDACVTLLVCYRSLTVHTCTELPCTVLAHCVHSEGSPHRQAIGW